MQLTESGVRRASRATQVADSFPTYRLEVRGVDAADVVGSAGGWLVDRVMAGWDVHVTLDAECDPRALHILGGSTGPFEPADTAPLALALSNRVLADTDLRAAVRRGNTEVSVWGGSTGLDGAVPVRHVLSSAARAFKAQALSALGLNPLAADQSELFRTANRSMLLVPSDLIPV